MTPWGVLWWVVGSLLALGWVALVCWLLDPVTMRQRAAQDALTRWLHPEERRNRR